MRVHLLISGLREWKGCSRSESRLHRSLGSIIFHHFPEIVTGCPRVFWGGCKLERLNDLVDSQPSMFDPVQTTLWRSLTLASQPTLRWGRHRTDRWVLAHIHPVDWFVIFFICPIWGSWILHGELCPKQFVHFGEAIGLICFRDTDPTQIIVHPGW